MPRPLALLLCAVALIGAAWALLVPPGQAPDEPAHIGYAQVLAEDFRLPDEKPGPTFSREQDLASVYSNLNQAAQVLLTKPEWSELAYEDWRRADARLPASASGDGGHFGESFPNPARTNPPLYYLWESVPYLAFSGGDFFDRLYAMRLWSVLLLLVATAATWLLIGELTGGRRTLQLAGAALVGLQPMTVFVSASVNPDAALIACFAVAFWLGARVLQRGLTLRDGVALGAVGALAVVTKGTGYALVPGVAVALGVGLWRLRPWPRSALVAGAASALALAIPVAAWLGLARALDRAAINRVPGSGGGASAASQVSLLDYLWQFYLPKLPFQGPVPAIPKLPAYDIWVKTGWGAFGWLEVRFPNAVYAVLAVVTVALLAGGAVVLLRRRRRSDLPLIAFFAVVALALLAGLHWIEFRSIVNDGVTFNQGRYLLPLLPLLAVAAAASLTLLPAARRALAAGVLVGGAFVLQVFSLALIVGRFYA